MMFSLSRKRKRKKAYNGTKEYREARRIRSSDRWQKIRSAFRIEYPLCRYCRKAPTEHVHHIEPVVEKPDLDFDWDNLFPACGLCHDEIHIRMKNGDESKKTLKEKRKTL